MDNSFSKQVFLILIDIDDGISTSIEKIDLNTKKKETPCLVGEMVPSLAS
ncbi:MAG: hypothetical protein U5K00_18035 [Melioribacteraceae bacterium]|nr:hypothetical protein [Melioribacteraceae bacterium]